MPSMYTFLGVLLAPDAEDAMVNASLVMQTASPVFSAPYWRNNAKLLPALRWLLRDLVVRRRSQLQRSGESAPDAFRSLRSHFISCVVAKLPHEEAVEQLEALIRAAKPVKSLMDEIVVPTAHAIAGLFRRGSIHVWSTTQWTAWRALVARMQGLPASSLTVSADAVDTPPVVLDVEDPDYVLAQLSAPLGEVACLLLQTRLGLAVEKARLAHAMQSAKALATYPVFRELVAALSAEVESSAPAKRALFADVSEAVAEEVASPSHGGAVSAAASAKMPRPTDGAQPAVVDGKLSTHNTLVAAAAPLSLEELHEKLVAFLRVECGAPPRVVDPFALFLPLRPLSSFANPSSALSRPPHWRCLAQRLVSGWSEQEVRAALPLLSLQEHDVVDEVPDAMFPLPSALYLHTQRLSALHSRIDAASLTRMLAVAEKLALVDPDKSVGTERAIMCFRSAVLRLRIHR